MPTKKLSPAASVFTLKVALLGSEPPIWRAVQVRGDTRLDELHRVLQAAFGWENAHMHEFVVGKQRYGRPDPEDGLETADESRVTIAEVAPKAGKKLVYTYDFGDSWEHGIEVEKVEAPVGGVQYPRLIDGARAGPPEDCGGVFGYAEKLEALKDKGHPDHEEMVEWLGKKFDPKKFDLKKTAVEVSRVR